MDISISHPTMTTRQFDTCLHRAHMDGCRVVPSGVAGVVFVTSGTRPGISYRVTRSTCSCPAGKVGRPCKHIALACAWADCFRHIGRKQPAAPQSNVRFIHTRRAATTDPKPAA